MELNKDFNEFQDNYNDERIKNSLLEEIFPDYSTRDSFEFVTQSDYKIQNDSSDKISHKNKMRPKCESGPTSPSHLPPNKKQKVLSSASDVLEEVRESYAFVQGIDFYAPSTSYDNFYNENNIQSQSSDFQQSYDYINEPSSNNPKLNKTPPKSFEKYETTSYTPQKTFSSPEPCNPLPTNTPTSGNQIINHDSPSFLNHPLYKLLRDIIIADMNFFSPSFPFSLILNLPEDFDRLLNNYYNRNPGLNLDSSDPHTNQLIFQALRFAHSSLISKIQTRKVKECLQSKQCNNINNNSKNNINANNNNNNKVDELCDYLSKNGEVGQSPKPSVYSDPFYQDYNDNNNLFESTNNNMMKIYNTSNQQVVLNNNYDHYNNTINNNNNNNSNMNGSNNNAVGNNNFSYYLNSNHRSTGSMATVSGQSNDRFNSAMPSNPLLGSQLSHPLPPHPSSLPPSSSSSPFSLGFNCNTAPVNFTNNNTLSNNNFNNTNNNKIMMLMMNGGGEERNYFQSLPSSPRKYMRNNPHLNVMFNNINHPLPPHSLPHPPHSLSIHPSAFHQLPPHHLLPHHHGNNNSNNNNNKNEENVTEKTGKNKVLPKEAVNLMIEWLRKHEDNPYPNDDEKEQLITQTKLSINQINYWFTNARRRILPKWALQKHLEEQEKIKNNNGSNNSNNADSNNNNNNKIENKKKSS